MGGLHPPSDPILANFPRVRGAILDRRSGRPSPCCAPALSPRCAHSPGPYRPLRRAAEPCDPLGQPRAPLPEEEAPRGDRPARDPGPEDPALGIASLGTASRGPNPVDRFPRTGSLPPVPGPSSRSRDAAHTDVAARGSTGRAERTDATIPPRAPCGEHLGKHRPLDVASPARRTRPGKPVGELGPMAGSFDATRSPVGEVHPLGLVLLAEVRTPGSHSARTPAGEITLAGVGIGSPFPFGPRSGSALPATPVSPRNRRLSCGPFLGPSPGPSRVRCESTRQPGSGTCPSAVHRPRCRPRRVDPSSGDTPRPTPCGDPWLRASAPTFPLDEPWYEPRLPGAREHNI